MTGNSSIEVILVGGPRDGAVIALDHCPHFLRTIEPVNLSPMTYDLHDDTYTMTNPCPESLYELDYADSRPSQDGQGRYRYQYRGTR